MPSDGAAVSLRIAGTGGKYRGLVIRANTNYIQIRALSGCLEIRLYRCLC